MNISLSLDEKLLRDMLKFFTNIAVLIGILKCWQTEAYCKAYGLNEPECELSMYATAEF